MAKEFLDGKLVAIVEDITKIGADAIVNAANSTLLGGGGVDGAIHRMGGSCIIKECQKIRETRYPLGLPTGEAVETKAGKLNARYVIHTVGPVWSGGKAGEDRLLANAYRNSLLLAEHLGCMTVAFPAISTGIYGFPADRASKIVYSTIVDYFKNHKIPEEVILVFYSEHDYQTFIQNCQDPNQKNPC